MMNAYELQALRHVFAMTIEECVSWIAPDYNAADWQQWENGECAPLPPLPKRCWKCVEKENYVLMLL